MNENYDKYRTFYIPVNIAFNLHIMLLAICNIQVKKKVKKRFEKTKKNKKYEKFVRRGFEPGPSESVRIKS